MAADAAIPGLFFCFVACLLLVIVSVSAPTWNAITFLQTTINGRHVNFGVFGYTGSGISVGYYFPPELLGFADTKLNDSTIHGLTASLILHPIAAGLSGLAVLFGLCGASYHRAGTVFMSLLAGLAFVATLIAWIIDMVIWGIAGSELRKNGQQARYGNANWLTLGALAALFIGFFTGACGVFGSYRRRRGKY
jgi:hypothetical protein